MLMLKVAVGCLISPLSLYRPHLSRRWLEIRTKESHKFYFLPVFFGQSWPPHLSWDTLVHPSLFCMENKSPAPSITVGREQVLRPPLEFNPTILHIYEEGFNIVHLGWTSLPAHI